MDAASCRFNYIHTHTYVYIYIRKLIKSCELGPNRGSGPDPKIRIGPSISSFSIGYALDFARYCSIFCAGPLPLFIHFIFYFLTIFYYKCMDENFVFSNY